jgi:hypothetical protein
VLFYGVVSDWLEEAVELLSEDAECVVLAWDRDEPDADGVLQNA